MILFFEQIGSQDLFRVGGKGANLGRLAAAGFPVPPGFCITTDGFRAFVANCQKLPALYDALDGLAPDDVDSARRLSAEVRAALISEPLPPAVADAALAAWRHVGAEHAYAVRSSATAEDLPGASFAGQQDTYLNVAGEAALLDAIRRCFASLYTDRAILYRAKGGFGHRGVALSVVVQRMVFPEAAGILFTADPVTGHRGTLTIDAGFGLGEALVSGLVTADLYRVDKQTGALKELRIGDKAVMVKPLPGGGTATEALSDEKRKARVLDEAAVQALAKLGAAVEAHYGGKPQDIEWCLEGGKLFLVQARPITSLYPLPEPKPTDGGLHVYFSFSHGQNMIDPISPLGIDLWRAVLPFGKSSLDEIPVGPTAVTQAGNRIYLDVTSLLRVKPLRQVLRGALRAVYPDIAAGIEVLAERPQVQAAPPPRRATLGLLLRLLGPVPPRLVQQLLWGRPEELPAWADEFVERQAAAYRARVRSLPAGAPRVREARIALAAVLKNVPRFLARLGAGLIAMNLLRRHFAGTAHAADVEALLRGLVGNITTEMDLQVGDLADLARPHPALVEALRRGAFGKDRAALEPLAALTGGQEFLAALDAFLGRFGMRGAAEIDVARPRWADQPGLLLRSIAGNLARPETGAHRARFQQLQAEGEAAGERLAAAAGGLFGGAVERLVRLARHGLGLREHPKYMLIRCLGELRAVIREAAQELVAKGRLETLDDVWLLRYDELLHLLESASSESVQPLLAARRKELETARHLSPPLVMTSEGEVPQKPPPKDLPASTLSGLGASAGVVEGVARVVLDPAVEVLQAGEILVAPYTDPGWTPLFVHAAGLVCDVGGMMTHGSVVAREYGIPAVVGVGSGTKRIRTGQRLRLDGSRGIVEVLEQSRGGA